jgi:hypothetical protein
VFRLARSVGEDGLRLERPAPFDIGRPVEVRFVLPEATEALSLRAEVQLADEDDHENQVGGGREIAFLDPPHVDRETLRRYLVERLGLPE